jgi:trans-aconitate methyltransferase
VPNDRQFQLKTRIIATRDVKQYRATIADVVTDEDVVLEIGCEWGTTTTLLAARARAVLATDVSSECLEQARKRHPDLSFALLDAFDIRRVAELGAHATIMYIDVSGFSGFRSLLDVLSLLNCYASVMSLRVIVVKSGALVNLARRLEARP